MGDDIAIRAEHVSKTFKLPHEKQSSLKGALINFRKRGYEKQVVLKDISFEVKKGEFFGIVGRNGSGKSTLLKLISGIYVPDSGSIAVNGRLTPFIELGVGFNPELTGRENVFLNGALLGFNRKEMESMYDDIVEFAELERFMDQKLKNYSSGMQVRLAFSIAIRANSDILILDEVLAVGDEAFQRKCEKFFEEIRKDKSKTVVLVTHGMDNVRKFCSRAMLIQDGELKMVGNPDKVADEYYGVNLLPTGKKKKEKKKDDANKPFISAKVISKPVLRPSDVLEVEIKYRATEARPVFVKAYIELDGHTVMATNPVMLGWKKMVTRDTKEHAVTYSLSLKDFNKGEFRLIALLEDVETGVNVASFGYDGGTEFKIESTSPANKGAIFANQAKMYRKA